MPELPEVETVVRNLNEMIAVGSRITCWSFYRKDLRFQIPQKDLKTLCNSKIKSITRRAKYIVIATENGAIISHLGMTGSWRRERKGWSIVKHDHLAFLINNRNWYVYNDPRRFGSIEFAPLHKIADRFSNLGAEPFDLSLNGAKMRKIYGDSRCEIKLALLNQKFLVGIGNIYASEILFEAGVNPFRRTNLLSDYDFERILKFTRSILRNSIENGGSSILSYKNSYGKRGGFQNKFLVYNREGQSCFKCKNTIEMKTQAGRSTFWCGSCQKKEV